MFKLYKNNSLNVIPWWTWTSKVYQRSECTTETTIGCPPLGRYSMYWQIWCGGPELACRPWVWLLWYNGFVHNVLPCLWPSCVASVALVTSSNYLHCNCAMVKNNRGLTRTLRSSVDNVFFFFPSERNLCCYRWPSSVTYWAWVEASQTNCEFRTCSCQFMFPTFINGKDDL